MKFFKYLIFIFLSLFSLSAVAECIKYQVNGKTYDTLTQACDAVYAYTGFPRDTTICSVYAGSAIQLTNLKGDFISNYGAVRKDPNCNETCKAGETAFLDGYITPPDGFSPDSVCYQGCTWTNTSSGGTAFDTPNGNLSWGFNAKNTGSKCSVETPKGEDKPVVKDGCKNGEAYCDKPSTGCPSGYTSGSFNGKQICVKNNPDPTKPNPNDPNNGGGKGEGSCNGTNNCNTTNFDDTKIINAINSSKTAITQAISSLSESITSSFTTVTNAINGTTNAVNNNTSAVNAVKSSVDALHNTINAVTTAVNNNTTSVTSAVHANTTATNAVKASVDALNSSISAVTSAVDNNTKAVNANGDKVANAVKDNITATNAVKTAVENLNTSVNAVAEAVKTNGKNTVDAVNANGDKVTNAINSNGDKVTEAVNKGVEATKENGKKLDGIKDGVENGNGILKQISNTLSEIKDFITEKPEFENGTDPQAPDDQGIFDRKFNTVFSLSKSCPPDIPFNYDTEFLKGNFTISLNWLCLIFTFLAYPLQFLSHCIGLWILYEAAIRKEIKW